MRVQITYSEELENIPCLVSEFLRETGKALLLLSNHVGSIDDNTIRDVLKGDEILEIIDSTRQQLAGLDQRLEDASSLLSGYNNTIQGNIRDDEIIETG